MIIHNGPLGSLTDSYKWCEILRDKYDITYVELDGVGRVGLDGIKQIIVSDKGNRLIRGIRYLFTCCLHILLFRGPIIVIYFKGCKILKLLFPWKRYLLDIRTLSVKKTPEERAVENEQIRKACRLYGRISIIQEDLLDVLKVDVEHHYLPLGADVISTTEKTFDNIRLLYVGTLEGRHIDDTIKGVSQYHMQHPDADITYDVIGEGFNDTSEVLKDLVDEFHLNNIITIHGRRPYSELKPFFDRCNVGVSHIPMKEWYDHQPPTKTFEYVMSGLYCLATRTSENIKIINDKNGCLYEDTPEGFCRVLERTSCKLSLLNSATIKNTIHGHSWAEVVSNYMLPALRTL